MQDPKTPDPTSTERRPPSSAGAGLKALVPTARGARTGRPAAGAQPPSEPASASAFAAQVLGQGGRKRGLKGGPPVLDEARSAYLEAEWSGPNDRRARLGRITRTEI